MIYNEKDLAYWMTRFVSEDREQRNAAAKAFEVLSNPDWELIEPDDTDIWFEEEKICSECFWAELRCILKENELEPFGMTSAEFVHQLLATHITDTENWHIHVEAEQQKQDELFEAFQKKYDGNPPPEALARWVRKRCLQIQRDFRNAEQNGYENGPDMTSLSGICILFTIQNLADEFLPALDTIRWMMYQEQHRHIAMDILHRLGGKGEGLLDDIFRQLLISPQHFGCNNSWQLGPLLRASPDAPRRLLALLDHEDADLVESALRLLLQCGPSALRYAPESEEKLISIVETTFNQLYGPAPVPLEDRKMRNDIYDRFACSVSTLGAVGQSERTKDVLLGLTNVDLAREPLKIDEERDFREDWELKVAPRQLILADVISALGFFEHFPEDVVPKLMEFFGEFQEFDCDMRSNQRIAGTLECYGESDPDLEPYWLRRQQPVSSEQPLKTFCNADEPYFDGLAEKLIGFIWEKTQEQADAENAHYIEYAADSGPDYDSDVVELLGRLGNRASCALPVLRDIKAVYEKHYGNDYFEENDLLLQTIRNIEYSQVEQT